MANDCNFQKATEVPLIMRAPFFEYGYTFLHYVASLTELFYQRRDTLGGANSEAVAKTIDQFVTNLEKAPSPRVIKTHLPLNLLHPKLLETSKVLVLLFLFF